MYYGDMAKDENEYRERNKGGSDRLILQLKRNEVEELLSILNSTNKSTILSSIISQIEAAL